MMLASLGLAETGAKECMQPLSPVLEFFSPNIIHLDMINLVVVLRTCAKFWKNSTVKIFCDNMAIVQVVDSGTSKMTPHITHPRQDKNHS